MPGRFEKEHVAIKAVLDKYYNGQERLFDDVLTQSVEEQTDCWIVTVYLSNIFREVSMTTYQVDKKKGVTKGIKWIREHG